MASFREKRTEKKSRLLPGWEIETSYGRIRILGLDSEESPSVLYYELNISPFEVDDSSILQQLKNAAKDFTHHTQVDHIGVKGVVVNYNAFFEIEKNADLLKRWYISEEDDLYDVLDYKLSDNLRVSDIRDTGDSYEIEISGKRSVPLIPRELERLLSENKLSLSTETTFEILDTETFGSFTIVRFKVGVSFIEDFIRP